ncbi:hypothetical protein NEDG_02021 [Nematocida displodere]|uniref:Uncharacterized protein n=1 Tax=Nematocida displodere TaxID=1805483 RepID=A0A177EHM0_9MICR|nr:hypothetical protein NEDG_02021 [Nematocida displodere]
MVNLKTSTKAALTILGSIYLAACSLNEQDNLQNANPNATLAIDKPEQVNTKAAENPTLNPSSDATIKLFEQCGESLAVSGARPNATVARVQKKRLNIRVEKLYLEDIPEKIMPGVVFGCITVTGASLKTEPSVQRPEEAFLKLARILRAFDGVIIEVLLIQNFNLAELDHPTNPELTQPRKPSLRGLDLFMVKKLSPFVFEWVCGAINLAKSSDGLCVGVFECSVTSVKCLDNLGIQIMEGFYLEDLPNLASIDCQLVLKKLFSHRLTLKNLSKDLVVSAAIAKSITGKEWMEVWMDMSIWNKICLSELKGIAVKGFLCLNVTDLAELQKNLSLEWEIVPSQIHAVYLEDYTPTTHLTKAFVDSVVEWADNNTDGMETLRIYGFNKPLEPGLVKALKSHPINKTKLLSLKTFVINGVSRPIKTYEQDSDWQWTIVG